MNFQRDWRRNELQAMQQNMQYDREAFDDEDDPESDLSTLAMAPGPLVVNAATGRVKSPSGYSGHKL